MDRNLIAAGEALRANRLDSALESVERALISDPDSVAARFLAGLIYSRTGDWEKAEGHLLAVLEADPRSIEALVSLSTVYRQSGNFSGAIALGQRVVQLRPNDVQAHNNLGRAFLTSRDLDSAADSFNRAIAIQPGFAAAHHNLGKAFQLEGKDGPAAECFAKAASLEPTIENHLAYGNALLALHDLEGASEITNWAVERFPDSAAARLLLSGVLIELNDTVQAQEQLAIAIRLDPQGREAMQIAARQLPLGHIEDATANLRRVIQSNPRQIPAYESLVQNIKISETDRELVDQMRGLLADGGLSPSEVGSLNYALGKACEDLAEYESAMHHFDEANRIVRQIKVGDIPVDKEAYARRIDRIIASFPRPEAGPSSRAVSDLPIFIIGMMRSGTTLVEQILSSHPSVAAGGERLFWVRNWTRAVSPGGDAFDAVQLEDLGREYLAELNQLANGASRVTDKLPGNYMFAGLIHQAVPNARFIHTRRNPADTCLSIWATPNHAPSEGGHEKASIVFVYRQYLRLMKHWRSVLPSDCFIEVDYEELVMDRERVTREMLAFCGLEWDEACLHPEDNKRNVSTLSLWQVRQPVYRTSVERWRRFEPWLGEFHELIGLDVETRTSSAHG